MQRFERRSRKTKKVHADNDDNDNDDNDDNDDADDGHRVIARVTLTRWVWLKIDCYIWLRTARLFFILFGHYKADLLFTIWKDILSSLAYFIIYIVPLYHNLSYDWLFINPCKMIALFIFYTMRTDDIVFSQKLSDYVISTWLKSSCL